MKRAALILFVLGLLAVALAMLMVVVVVLRPRQVPTRRMFFTDALIGLWMQKGRSAILDAGDDKLNMLFVDRLLRTLAYWSLRNREKARWLRRGWMFLAYGILLIGGAGTVVASDVLDYSLVGILGIVGAGLVAAWFVLKLDLIRAGREDPEGEETKRENELSAIAKWFAPDEGEAHVASAKASGMDAPHDESAH